MSKIVNISKAKKKNKSNMLFLSLTVIVGAVCFLLLSPIFNIKNIVVKGVLRLSENSIIETSGFYYGQNILSINKTQAIEDIKQISYVEDVSIKRIWPDKLYIDVLESEPIAEVKFYGSVLKLDKNGKVLEVVTDLTPTNLIELVGITVNEIVTGKKISANETEKLEDFLEVLKNLEENDMLKNIIRISEDNGILIYLKEGHVSNIGDTDNLPYKITLLKELIVKEDTASYIDLHDLTRIVTKPVWGMFDSESE